MTYDFHDPKIFLKNLEMKSNIKIKDVIVIGNLSLAISLDDIGVNVDFVVDNYFFKVSKDVKRGQDVLRGLQEVGINNTGALTSFYFSAGFFAGNREMKYENDSDVPWDAIICDTQDYKLHPSFWSFYHERTGSDIKDIDGILRLLKPGGILCFKEIDKPEVTDEPIMWRENWSDFLKEAFENIQIEKGFFYSKRKEISPELTFLC